MHVIVYVSLIVSAFVAVFAVFKPDKLRPGGKLTWTGRLTVLATLVAVTAALNAQWIQDRRDCRARDERMLRIERIQDDVISCFEARFLANLKLYMLDHCTEADWRRLSQVTDLGRIAHMSQLRQDEFEEAIQPLLIPLTYTRMLDTPANLRGTPLPDRIGEHRWREILIADLEVMRQQFLQASEQHAQYIPYDLQQNLQTTAGIAGNLADIYRKQGEENEFGREYIHRSVAHLLYTASDANRRLLRLRVGADSN
jgi:hypothetical protein